MVWIAIIYSSIWVPVGAAITVAIQKTGNWKLLWFFLIPALFGPPYSSNGDE